MLGTRLSRPASAPAFHPAVGSYLSGREAVVDRVEDEEHDEGGIEQEVGREEQQQQASHGGALHRSEGGRRGAGRGSAGDRKSASGKLDDICMRGCNAATAFSREIKDKSDR